MPIRAWLTLAAIVVAAMMLRIPGLDRILVGSEVDYVVASRRGVLVNYVDAGTRPLPEYIRAALALRGVSPTALEDADIDLWQRDVREGDIAAQRHYHAPGFVYALAAAQGVFGRSDRAIRLAPLLFALATVGLVFVAALVALGPAGHAAGLVAAAIVASSSLHVENSTEITWHVMYACFALGSLVAMARLLVRPSPAALVWACVTAAVALVVLEHALFLFMTLGILLLVTENPWLRRSGSRVVVHRAVAAGIGAAVATLLLLWPAALLKLSLVKNIGVQAYYSRALELSPRFFDVYLLMLRRYTDLATMAAATALLCAVHYTRVPRALLPFALYPLLFVALQLTNSNLKPLYFVSVLAPIALLTGFWLTRWLGDTRRAVRMAAAFAVAALLAGLLSQSLPAIRAGVRQTAPLQQLVARLDRADARGGRILTWPPGSHAAQTLSFYLPAADVVRVREEPAEVALATLAVANARYDLIVSEVREDGRDTLALNLRHYVPVFEATAPGARTRFVVFERQPPGVERWTPAGPIVR